MSVSQAGITGPASAPLGRALPDPHSCGLPQGSGHTLWAWLGAAFNSRDGSGLSSAPTATPMAGGEENGPHPEPEAGHPGRCPRTGSVPGPARKSPGASLEAGPWSEACPPPTPRLQASLAAVTLLGDRHMSDTLCHPGHISKTRQRPVWKDVTVSSHFTVGDPTRKSAGHRSASPRSPGRPARQRPLSTCRPPPPVGAPRAGPEPPQLGPCGAQDVAQRTAEW